MKPQDPSTCQTGPLRIVGFSLNQPAVRHVLPTPWVQCDCRTHERQLQSKSGAELKCWPPPMEPRATATIRSPASYLLSRALGIVPRPNPTNVIGPYLTIPYLTLPYLTFAVPCRAYHTLLCRRKLWSRPAPRVIIAIPIIRKSLGRWNEMFTSILLACL
jgi:hypothetical protein